MNAVEFDRVSKNYALYDAPRDRLKELALLGRHSCHRDFQALRELSFSVRRGEVFCIVGANGSGKSTALQLMAGILQPTEGEVRVQGRIAALLELGAGFNPEFTGRENVYLNGSILGFSKRELDARLPRIEEFAGIGDFINRPVKTYSSGMTVRLAFAVAIHVDPEVLLVDEALAVGDASFRGRCISKVQELRTRGVTIIFVSHSVAEVRAIGERVLWLNRGRTMAIGDTETVLPQYLAAMTGDTDSTRQSGPVQPIQNIPNVDHRHGDRSAGILGIAVLDQFGDPLHLMLPESRILVRISILANRAMARPDLGFILRNHLGLDFSETSAAAEGHGLPAMQTNEIRTIDFHLDIPELYPGAFSFSPWLIDRETGAVCDWIDNALTIQMARREKPVYGYVQWPARIELNSPLQPESALV